MVGVTPEAALWIIRNVAGFFTCHTVWGTEEWKWKLSQNNAFVQTLIQWKILKDPLGRLLSSLCPHRGLCSLLLRKGKVFTRSFDHSINYLLVSFEQRICLVPVLSECCLILIVSCFTIISSFFVFTKKHNDLPKVLNLHDVAVFVPNHDVSFSFIQHSIQQQQHLHTTINNGKYRSLAFFNLVSYFLFNICKCIRVCRIHGAGKHEILKKLCHHRYLQGGRSCAKAQNFGLGRLC